MWKTLWGKPIVPLYKDLIKVEVIVLFLLYIEVIGLNIWLASIDILEILPQYKYG